LPAALLALVLLLLETFILLHKNAVTRREISWGWAGTLGVPVVGTVLCVGLLAFLIAVGKIPPLGGASWIAQPSGMHVATAAIALFTAAGASTLLGKRAGFWGLWVAASLLVAILAVACAATLPGAGFVLLLAAVAAGLGALPHSLSLVRAREPGEWTADAAAMLPAWVIFAGLFALLRFMYMALGSLAWPISTLLLSLGAALLLPSLTVAGRPACRRIIALTSLLILGGVAVTLYLPTYSADWPEHINVEYWFDADTAQSNYRVRADSRRLPSALAGAAHFDRAPRPRFQGSGAPAFFAPAPELRLAAPELTLTTPPTSTPAAATHFALRVRSLRGAPEALVVFPASAGVAEVSVATAGGPQRSKLSRLKSGATLLDMVGLPAAGAEFSADVAGSQPVAVQVFDQSYELAEGRNLQRLRPPNATSSQDGDLTVAHRTVSLDPAAGR
jgi:hypothetical protein